MNLSNEMVSGRFRILKLGFKNKRALSSSSKKEIYLLFISFSFKFKLLLILQFTLSGAHYM